MMDESIGVNNKQANEKLRVKVSVALLYDHNESPASQGSK